MSKGPWTTARFETARFRRGNETVSRLVVAVKWCPEGESRRRRFRFSTGVPDTPTARKLWRPRLRQMADEIARGDFDPRRWFPQSEYRMEVRRAARPGQRTVEQYAHSWLTELPATGAATNTLRQYEIILKAHLFGTTLAAMPISAVTDSDIKRFVLEMRERRAAGNRRGELGANTVNKIMARLRTIFALAYRRGDIERDPMRLVPNLREPAREVDPFTADELVRICETASGQQRWLYLVLGLTGLRPNEALGLEWGHLDFERSVITVRQQMTEAGTPTPHLKTARSRRDVEMFEPVAMAFAKLRALDLIGSRWVFSNRIGYPLKSRTIGDAPWRQTLDRAAIAYRPLYNLRHSYTSLMIAAGRPLQWVAHQLGHVTVRKIDETYGRWLRVPDNRKLELRLLFDRMMRLA